MATYNLLDTGYANIGANGTQETRAYGGSVLSINTKSLTWERSTGTSSNSNPGTYESTEVNYVSVGNPRLVIIGVIEINDANYNTKVAGYDDMSTTKGLKHLYYDSTTDGYNPITNVKGSVTHGSLQVNGTIKSLLVRVLSFRFNEVNRTASTKGLREFTLTLEVTNPKQ